MPKRFFSALMLLALMLSFAHPAAATQTDQSETPDPVPVYTVQDLMDMSKDPEGSYILMADLDMTGVEWKALDFSGTFDGNGHAILNLTITEPGGETPDAVDGNKNAYEGTYYGFFGTLRNAQVKNLLLLNVKANVTCDAPCFLGGLAGYAENSTITDCSVMGTLELRADTEMFGIGGLVGYGSGTVRRCTISVTLISVDTNAQELDEQFLGGVYAAGFINVYDCNVKIDGYISEHGYVHSGGIAGMFAEYPLGQGQKGYINNNNVTGRISFFENNPDRRAYCKALVGEAMVARYYTDGNKDDFTRDEVKDYSVELRPEKCTDPHYTEQVVEPGCERYGFTLLTCEGCGYSFRDSYKPFAHTVTEWKLTKAPTQDEEGESVGRCDCGLKFTRTEPKLEPETEPIAASTEAPVPENPENPAGQPEQPEEKTRFDKLFYVAVCCDAVLLLCAVAVIRALRRRK